MTQRALLSAYDKTGIVELAQALHGLGVELVSSSGTATKLREAGLPVTDVAEITGIPPILDHKVVTLHPKIHGGILAEPDKSTHKDDMTAYDISPFTIVVVNLYPFVKEPSVSQIDIGGPAMVRAAAKNHEYVTILVDPTDYTRVLEELANDGRTSLETRRFLARKAFAHTATYDAAILDWFNEGDPLPQSRVLAFELVEPCAYGENGWQTPAGVYHQLGTDSPLGFDKFQLVTGMPPSANNQIDLERARQTATHIAAGFARNFGEVPYIAIAVKHGNACGVGIDDSSPEIALQKAIKGDRRAIHGAVVLTNFTIESSLADMLLHLEMTGEQRRLLDTIAAPGFSEQAIEALARKKGKCRLMACPALSSMDQDSLDTAIRSRYLRDGQLFQPNYTFVWDFAHPEFEWVGPVFSLQQQRDAVLAWAIGSTSNSNTVTLVRDGMLIGNGVGQQDRVGCAELAIKRAFDAGHFVELSYDGVSERRLPEGTVPYTDSFFPFPDGAETLIAAGVRCVIGTRGSVNDGMVAEVFKKHGASLGWLPDPSARGFYGH